MRKSTWASSKIWKLNMWTVHIEKGPVWTKKNHQRAWFGRFTNVMKDYEYKKSQGGHNLSVKHSKSKGVVYVDDIIINGDNEEEKLELS